MEVIFCPSVYLIFKSQKAFQCYTDSYERFNNYNIVKQIMTRQFKFVT